MIRKATLLILFMCLTFSGCYSPQPLPWTFWNSITSLPERMKNYGVPSDEDFKRFKNFRTRVIMHATDLEDYDLVARVFTGKNYIGMNLDSVFELLGDTTNPLCSFKEKEGLLRYDLVWGGAVLSMKLVLGPSNFVVDQYVGIGE